MTKRSNVRDDSGRITAVDISHGNGRVDRYEARSDGSTTKLIGVVRDGVYYETAGTDIFGSPIYTGESSKIDD